MRIGNTPTEQKITLDDTKDAIVVEKNQVASGDTTTPAYKLEGPEGYLVGIMAGTSVAPYFHDVNGEKLDDSTRLEVVKCDKQGNRLGEGVVFSDLLSKFDYEKMRTDPDFWRKTTSDLMLNEREIVKVFVDIPEGAAAFDPDNSHLTIGDDTSDYGQPVEIVDHDDLSGAESAAIAQASQSGGN